MSETKYPGDIHTITNSFEEQEQKQEELRVMKQRIESALADPVVAKKVVADFTHTFNLLGLSQTEAADLCTQILTRLKEPRSLQEIEQETLAQFENTYVGDAVSKKNLTEILAEQLEGRANKIYSQVAFYLKDTKGKVFDYGAGDGQVTQKLADSLHLDIEGADVRPYVASNVKVPIHVFDGKYVDVPGLYYDAAVMTNVLHHEKDNEAIIKELSRIVANKLVIVETVPVGITDRQIKTDKERTFMNDYLYNRLFHNADVPVPGTFETPAGWIKRFEKHGWHVTHSEDLGVDQPTINDTHHLLVFERQLVNVKS